MPLTNGQRNTLKAAIAAETDAAFVALRQAGDEQGMAAWYNAALTPNVKAWVSNVTPLDSDEATPWPAFDSLSAGKRESWSLFLNNSRDYGKGAVRKWITDVWGNATAGSSAEAIMLAEQRNITRAENVLGGSNVVTTGTVSGRKLSWEGPLTAQDVSDSLRS
jgi:hypothetical protein